MMVAGRELPRPARAALRRTASARRPHRQAWRADPSGLAVLDRGSARRAALWSVIVRDVLAQDGAGSDHAAALRRCPGDARGARRARTRGNVGTGDGLPIPAVWLTPRKPTVPTPDQPSTIAGHRPKVAVLLRLVCGGRVDARGVRRLRPEQRQYGRDLQAHGRRSRLESLIDGRSPSRGGTIVSGIVSPISGRLRTSSARVF